MLKLDESDRKLLKKPVGRLVNELEFVELAGACRPIAIGDVCCKLLLQHGITPWIGVVDLKSMRVEVDGQTRGIILDFAKGRRIFRLDNPPGCLNEQALPVAQTLCESADGGVLFITGEEDLLALAFIATCEGGDVFYGQPNEGIVHVKVNKSINKFANRIINNMKKME